MTDILPLNALTIEDIRDVVRRALQPVLDSEAIADFVASVDWSDPDPADPQVARIVGQVEMWATEYAEGDLSQTQYIANLLTLLPQAERSATVGQLSAHAPAAPGTASTRRRHQRHSQL